MPIDPQIPLSVRGVGPIVNPMDVMQGVQQARSQREQTDALAEQRRSMAEQTRLRTEEARRAQAEELRLRSVYTEFAKLGKPVPLATLTGIVGPEKGQKLYDAHLALEDRQAKSADEMRDRIARGVGAVDAFTSEEMRKSVYENALNDFQQRGWLKPEEVLPYSPESVSFYQRRGVSADKQYDIAHPKPNLHNANPGDVVLDANNPKAGPVYTAPPKPPERETRGLDVQAAAALAAGNQAEYDRLLKVKKDMGRADDRPVDPNIAALREITLANAKQNQAQGALPPRVQTRADAVARGFDSQPVVRRVQTMAEAVTFANSLDLKTKNPQDDQALIYAYAKAMDPESVVREGEYATVQKYAQSWAESLGFNAQRIFSNSTFLTEQARANMKATIGKKFEATKAQYDNLRASSSKRINAITGLTDGEERLTDYGGAFPGPTAAAPAQKPGAPPAQPASGMIRARDPQGNIHEAKKGTPLPQGWTIVGGG